MSNKIKILYVDDEYINLQLFEINFGNKYLVFTAEDGLRGLELLDKHNDISVVISDMRMPIMNGLEFIRAARKKYPEMIYYILTGFELTAEIQNAIDTKVIAKYFSKPFDYNQIDHTIQKATEANKDYS